MREVIMRTDFTIDQLEERIEKLEEWTHPPVAPGGTTELVDLITKLEKRIEILESNQKEN